MGICITMLLSSPAIQVKVRGVGKEAFGISSNDTFKKMPSRHAEADAFNKIRFKKNMPRHIDVFVIRIGKSGQFGNSRPCRHCIEMMERSGFHIKNVYYSDSDGFIIKEKFQNMKSSDITYVSSGMRTKTKTRTKTNK